MPPKKAEKNSTSFNRKQPRNSGVAKTGGSKPVDGALHQPVYLDMGKKRVQFLHDAARLDEVLKKTYGSSFSISKLEKSFIELKGKSALRSLVYLPDNILALHATYQISRLAMVEESSLLRKSFLATHIPSSSITTADELFAETLSSKGKEAVETNVSAEKGEN